MIENLIPKTIVNIALIIITLVIGIVLHKLGRPYNNFVFAIHKLTTVVFVVLLIRMIIPYIKINGVNAFIIILFALATISVLGLIVSGGAMSLNRSHSIMLNIHKISTLLFLLSASGIFYSLFQIKQ